jgi:hypothetical protein
MKRRWLFWLLVIAFLVFVVSRLTEIGDLLDTLRRGRWEWVLAAALAQVIYHVVYTGIFRSAFHVVSVESRVQDLLPVRFAALFVNTVVPVATLGGTALFMDDAAQRGESPSRAAGGVLITLLVDITAFVPVMSVGLLYLGLRDVLRTYQLLTAFVVLLMTGGLGTLLLLGRREERLRSVLDWVQKLAGRVAGWVNRSPPLAEDWAAQNAAEFAAAAAAVAEHPWRLARTLGVALLAHVLNMLSLYLLILAFYHWMGAGALVAGYAISLTFRFASITPQGVGVAEGVVVLAFESLGMPAATATAVTLAFHGLSVWLPILIGFVVLRWLKTFQTEVKDK